MKMDDNIHEGFRIPENYMEELDERILRASSGAKISPDEEMKKHFKVPPSYFEGLEDRILDKSKGRIIFLSRPGFSILALAVAASVALLIAINLWSGQKNGLNSWDDLQDKDVIGFIDEDYDIFNSSDIADAFEGIDLESEIYAEMDIENYLEEVDLETIITEN